MLQSEAKTVIWRMKPNPSDVQIQFKMLPHCNRHQDNVHTVSMDHQSRKSSKRGYQCRGPSSVRQWSKAVHARHWKRQRTLGKPSTHQIWTERNQIPSLYTSQTAGIFPCGAHQQDADAQKFDSRSTTGNSMQCTVKTRYKTQFKINISRTITTHTAYYTHNSTN